MVRKLVITVAVVVWSAASHGPAAAGSIADAPPPLLNGTTKAKVIYSVTGVTDSGSRNLATLFHCTSTERTGGKPITVGVEVFDVDGTLKNDVRVGQGVVSVQPGHTATIGTRSTASFGETAHLRGLSVRQGSARILATSKRIICGAMIVNDELTPPTSMVSLPVFKKMKQSGQ
jgi:hypothetical protein